MSKVTVSVDPDKKDFSDKYSQAITDLTSIINENSPTNAWAITSIKTMAVLLRTVIKLAYKRWV